MQRIFAILVVAALALRPTLSHSLEQPDHEQWQLHVTAVETALASGDLAALEVAMRGVFEQAIRMPDGDARLQQSVVSLNNAASTLRGRVPANELVEFYLGMHELTNVPQGLRSPFSLIPTDWIVGKYSLDEDYDAALAFLDKAAVRATADLGATAASARNLRRQQALVAARALDYDRALALQTELRDTVRRTFGPESVQYAEVLIDIADVHAQRDEVAAGLAAANEADKLLTRRPLPDASPYARLYVVYRSLGNYERAAEVAQRLETNDVRMPGYAQIQSHVTMEIAYLNAMIGDGVTAKRYMTRSRQLAEQVASESAPIMLGALRGEARILNLAELNDEAVQRIEQIERMLAGSEEDRRNARADLASAYIGARRYDVALRIGEELLTEAQANTRAYHTAALLVAQASALSTPPRPRLDLAERALAAARARQPNAAAYREQYVLALTYAAAGRTTEAVALHKKLIDEESALYGERSISASQWRQYAKALDAAGNTADAQVANTRADRMVAALAPALSSAALATTAIDVRSDFGFHVTLTNDNWRQWPPASVGWPIATFGAQYYSKPGLPDATFAVVPFLLPEGMSAQTALDGLTTIVNSNRSALVPWTNGSLAGYEHRFSRSNVPGRPQEFVVRFLVEESAVYVLIAYGARSNPEAIAAAQAALDAVTLDKPLDVAELDANERTQYGKVLTYVASGIATPERTAEALRTFELARTYTPTTEVQRGIAFLNFQLGNAAVVIDEVSNYLGNLDADPVVLLWRAFSYRYIGDSDAAIADFDRAFATGLRDDASVETYVELLMAAEREGEAAVFLETYASAGRSPAILSLQALVYASMGATDKLDVALLQLEDPEQSSTEAALMAAVVQFQMEGLDALAALTTRLAAAGLASPELYLLRANAEIAEGRMSEARTSVHEGLKLSPNHAELLEIDERLDAAAGPQL